MIMVDMGERIKSLRESHKMTQEELGAIIGVQKSAVRKYEKGEVQNLKRSSIKKLADHFNVSPSYLMGLSDDPNEPENHNPITYSQMQQLLTKHGLIKEGEDLSAEQLDTLLRKLGAVINALSE